jgi:hypothetical protein
MISHERRGGRCLRRSAGGSDTSRRVCRYTETRDEDTASACPLGQLLGRFGGLGFGENRHDPRGSDGASPRPSTSIATVGGNRTRG